MASSFFLGVGLYVALFSGLREGTAMNCTLPDDMIDGVLNGSFVSVSDMTFDGCDAVFDLIERLENLTWALNTTNIEHKGIMDELASRSVTFSTPDEGSGLAHKEKNESLTLNCSATVPTTYEDVSISLMRDGEDVPIDKAWHGIKVVATNVTDGTDGMRSRRFTIQHPVPKNLTGDFTCVMDAASSEGHHSVSWTIPVMVHELLHVEVKDVETTEDKAVNILCTVTGNPIPDTVTWTETGGTEHTLILENGTSTYLLTSKPEKEFTRVFTLTILHPKVNMNGYQYSCSAVDSINGTSIASEDAATLSVTKEALASVHIVQSPNPVKVGNNVTLTCSATAKRQIVFFTWKYSNKTEIRQGDDGGVLTLLVQDYAGDTWSKKVTCIVTLEAVNNQAGVYDADYEVNITTPTTTAPTTTPTTPAPTTTAPTTIPTTPDNSTGPTDGQQSPSSVSMIGIAVTVVVLVVLCGAVYVVYWKRHTLRAWLMEKDVVKVIKKQKRAKGYKYSKLPRDITTSMKHLE